MTDQTKATLTEEDLVLAAIKRPTSDIPDTLRDLMDRIKSLDEERKHLLIDEVLTKMAVLLVMGSEPGSDSVSAMLLCRNLLNLAGFVNTSVSVDHEDWTRTGDKLVDDLWNEYVQMIDHVRLKAEDLPPEVAERMRNGTATDEDFATVVKVVAEKTGADPDDLDLDKSSFRHMQDRVAQSTQPGTGQYL